MPGRLTERSGKQVKTVHVLGEGVTSICRADDNMLVIASDGISRHHAEVHWDGRQYVLIDLDSKNGTWLNGQRLTSPQPLQPGDIIGFPCQPVRYLVFDVSKETVTVRPEEVFADAPDESTAALRAACRDLWMDPRTAEVWVHGRQVQVTAKEYRA